MLAHDQVGLQQNGLPRLDEPPERVPFRRTVTQGIPAEEQQEMSELPEHEVGWVHLRGRRELWIRCVRIERGTQRAVPLHACHLVDPYRFRIHGSTAPTRDSVKRCFPDAVFGISSTTRISSVTLVPNRSVNARRSGSSSTAGSCVSGSRNRSHTTISRAASWTTRNSSTLGVL